MSKLKLMALKAYLSPLLISLKTSTIARPGQAANMFAALGSCWWPTEIVPPTFRTLGMISPAYWAMDAFHQVIFFSKGLESILPIC